MFFFVNLLEMHVLRQFPHINTNINFYSVKRCLSLSFIFFFLVTWFWNAFSSKWSLLCWDHSNLLKLNCISTIYSICWFTLHLSVENQLCAIRTKQYNDKIDLILPFWKICSYFVYDSNELNYASFSSCIFLFDVLGFN